MPAFPVVLEEPLFSGVLTASAVQDLSHLAANGLVLILDVTAVSGTTPTLDVKVSRRDALSGKIVDIPGAAFTQKTAAGTDMLTIALGVTPAANKAVSDHPAGNLRVTLTVGGTTPSFTCTLSARYLP